MLKQKFLNILMLDGVIRGRGGSILRRDGTGTIMRLAEGPCDVLSDEFDGDEFCGGEAVL